MLRQKMINFIYMYIWESNKESILAYMDYINDFFFHIGIPLPYLRQEYYVVIGIFGIFTWPFICRPTGF